MQEGRLLGGPNLVGWWTADECRLLAAAHLPAVLWAACSKQGGRS